jgi:hypothetical protein
MDAALNVIHFAISAAQGFFAAWNSAGAAHKQQIKNHNLSADVG